MTQHKLERILASHNRPVRVHSVQVAPQVIRYEVVPLHRRLANGKDSLYMTTVGQLRRLTDDIEAGMGQGPVTVSLEDGKLWVELQRDFPAKVMARGIEVGDNCKLPLVLGKTVSGDDLVLDLASPATPSVLIGGTTGSGKTILLHSICWGLCRWTSPKDTHLILIDTNSPSLSPGSRLTLAEGSGLGVWNGAAHTYLMLTKPVDVLGMLGGIKSLLRKRYAEGSPPSPRYVIVIDELADLLGDPVYGDEIENLIAEVAQISRKKGVHIVAATQRPSADVIKGMAKANFPTRIAMTVASSVDSRIIIDQKGAERLGGKGDGLLRVGMDVTRFQGGLVTDQDVQQVRLWGVQWKLKTGGYKRKGVSRPVVVEKEESVDGWLQRLFGWNRR